MKQKFMCGALLMALLIGAFAIAPPPTASHAQELPPVWVRVIHAFPAETGFDVYIDGSLVVRNVGYGTATPYFQMTQHQADIAVRVTESDPSSVPIAQRNLDIVTTSIGFGHVALVIQADNFNQVSIGKMEDMLSPLRIGQSRVAMIHAAPQAGPVDLLLADGSPFLRDVAFNTITGTIDPPAGHYEFVIAPAGISSGSILLQLEPLDLRTGFLHTILLMPLPGGVGLQTQVLETPVRPDPNSETALVQFGHGSPNAPAFDIYANDSLLLPNLQLGELVQHFPLPVGEIALSIREAGSPASISPATETTLTLSSGYSTIIAQGSLDDGSFTFATYADDTEALTSDSVRLRVINATSNGPLTLALNDGTVIANALPRQEAAAPVTVPIGVYSIEGVVDDAEINGPLTLNANDSAFAGGTWVTVLAYTADDPALTLSSTTISSDTTSLPGYETVTVETPEPIATLVAETPPPATTPEPVATNPAGPILSPAIPENGLMAEVRLDAGRNLQCREYPTPQARSIGLIPNTAFMPVLGYAGPIDPENGEPFTPLAPGAFSDPESAVLFEEVWLQADWYDTQITRCWVRADFVLLTFYEKNQPRLVIDPAALFEIALLEDSPIQRIPANYAGEVGVQPVVPTVTVPIVTPTLIPAPPDLILGSIAVATNLLDFPINGSTVQPLINGTTVVILGRNTDATWLNVRYETLGVGVFLGWVPTDTVTITTPIPSIADLPVTE